MGMNEAPQKSDMSTVETLYKIFYEPTSVFAELNRSPRFLVAVLLAIAAVTLMNFVIVNKVGFERALREQLENSPATQQMSSEQKDRIVEQQTGTAMTVVRAVSVPIVTVVIILCGGLYYFVCCNALDGSSSFGKGVTVWAYSSLPPLLVLSLLNILVALLKSADDMDASSVQGGLFKANPTLFLDVEGPLGALLSALDAFAIWGWILAAIGLNKMCKVSLPVAWGIVGLLGLLGVAVRVALAAMF